MENDVIKCELVNIRHLSPHLQTRERSRDTSQLSRMEHDHVVHVSIQCHVTYTVGPVLNAWFNDCVLRVLLTL